MNTTVNIAFKRELLAQIDKVAKEESRSRSEFLREAARAYIHKSFIKQWRVGLRPDRCSKVIIRIAALSSIILAF